MSQADRRKYLGGTDAAGVLGVSDRDTPVTIWREKALGEKREVSEAVKRMFRRGKRLEPIIRTMVIEKLADEGHDVELTQCNERYTDAEYPFLSCEIDFELRVDGLLVPADAKSVSGYARTRWGDVGTDAMPIEYAAQFMHGLGIHPLQPRRTLVAALRSFDDVDIYWLDRDEETIAAMREKMVRFWLDHVVTKIPPDPETYADVRALFQKARASNVEATPEIMAKVDRLGQIPIERAALEAEEEQIRFEIARFMGPHALLTNGVRDVIEWTEQKTRRFDLEAFRREHPDWVALFTKETSTRVMRRAKKRG